MRYTGKRVLVSVIVAGLCLGAPSVASATANDATALRAASPEAKKACKRLKQKAKGLDGKARGKALKKYRKCLQNYDAAHPPAGDGGDNGGDGGDSGGDGTGGGTTPSDPKAAAQALIENHEFYRPFAGTYSSGDELIRFCSGGTYFRRYTSSSDLGVTEYHDYGNWSITDAKQGTQDGYTGYVAGVAVNGTYDGGQVSGSIGVAVSSQTSQSLINVTGGANDWREYIRRAPTGTGTC